MTKFREELTYMKTLLNVGAKKNIRNEYLSLERLYAGRTSYVSSRNLFRIFNDH